jgi:hypothetical protein
MTHCTDHPVAVCVQCSEHVAYNRIGADLILGRRDFCPACRANLAAPLRKHLVECTMVRVQARETHERSHATPPEALQAADAQNSLEAPVQASQRLRRNSEDAIDEVQRIGMDYIAIKPRAAAAALTAPPDDGMLAHRGPRNSSKPPQA